MFKELCGFFFFNIKKKIVKKISYVCSSDTSGLIFCKKKKHWKKNRRKTLEHAWFFTLLGPEIVKENNDRNS